MYVAKSDSCMHVRDRRTHERKTNILSERVAYNIPEGHEYTSDIHAHMHAYTPENNFRSSK